ncbi:MAG: hypothetical protein Q8M29_06670 [Bacteroidota bacterium]|nr:hypothetical protein [Bacteroidota bacterium]
MSVLNIDSKGVNMEPTVMGNMVRMELEKLDSFDVMDRYDVSYMIEKNKLSINNCYGKICLVEVGTTIQSDKMFSGTVEQFGKSIILTFRIIDVKNNAIEKTHVKEYLNIPEELQSMVKISINELFNKPNEKVLVDKLTKKFEFDNSTNNPDVDRLKLDGPRMGFVSYIGSLYERMQEGKSTGGFNAFPMMFQFGYQFEKQYLNEGKVQALFEFLPMITGLDQGYFIPSFTVMHGVRSNVNGWEFAFGPSFSLVTKANGYYDADNKWQLEKQWSSDSSNVNTTNPFPIVERIDSRGTMKLQSSFVFAFGRTFKSGRLNIPVNAFFIPGREGWRIGASFGFNSKIKK